jgi:transaldolase
MPEQTLRAFADRGAVHGDQVTGRAEDAARVLATLTRAGIDYDDVVADLEREGLAKFITSWNELTQTVRDNLMTAQRCQRSAAERTA